ncbi:MAG TPA: hypothetical protein VL171_06645 [Verrucomicrobiae bacterium]|nr:hypothetical protein [Verrucomicrobiae bacterium]
MKRWIVSVILCSTLAAVVDAASTKDKQKALDRANYVAYQGEQQAWPTSDQNVPNTIETKQGVTIYRSLPSRLYEILGVIQVTHDDKVAKRVSAAAHAAGANAVLVCADDAFVKAGITIQPSLVIEGKKASGITSLTGFLIRWKLVPSGTSASPTNGPATPPAPSS